MKRNYQYLQGGGNLPQKKLPKLDDSEIEKLYKLYTSKDKFYSKFKGTKREYCSSVANLIEVFYQKNNLDNVDPNKFKKLIGKGKDDEEINKIIKENILIKPEKDSEGKEYSDIYTRGVTKDRNVYTQGDLVRRSKSTFFTKNRGDDLTYSDLLRHFKKYEKVIEIVFEDTFGLDNFLLTTKFPVIADINASGNKERGDFFTRLKYAGIVLTQKVKEWKQEEEQSFRTEYLFARYILRPLGYFTDLNDEELRFLCMKKLFSEKDKYVVVDFPMNFLNAELKGNKTIGDEDKGLQVDTKKVTEIILDSFKTGSPDTLLSNPKFAHIFIMKYVNNTAIINVEYDSDGNLISPLPIQGIIDWDISDMFRTPKGIQYLYEVREYLKKYNNEKRPQDATEMLTGGEIDRKTFNLVRDYFDRPIKGAIGGPKANTDPADKITSLTLDISNPKISKKLKLVAYADTLGLGDNPTVADFYKKMSDPGLAEDFVAFGANDLIVNMRVINEIKTKDPEPLEIKDLGLFDADATVLQILNDYGYETITIDNLRKFLSVIIGVPFLPEKLSKPALMSLVLFKIDKGPDPGIDLSPPKEDPYVTLVKKLSPGIKSIGVGNLKDYLKEKKLATPAELKEIKKENLTVKIEKYLKPLLPKEELPTVENTIVSEEESEEEKRKKEITKKLSSDENVTEDEYRELAFLFGYTDAKDPEVKLENVKKSLLKDGDFTELLEKIQEESS
jgi:hypothetical protein